MSIKFETETGANVTVMGRGGVLPFIVGDECVKNEEL